MFSKYIFAGDVLNIHCNHNFQWQRGACVALLLYKREHTILKDPFGAQADKQHILAAVLTCQPSAQGGRYLQRTLAKELQSQIRQHGGDVKAALPAALSALNQAYRNMHPFNGLVLENVQAAIVYADLRSQVCLFEEPLESRVCPESAYVRLRISLVTGPGNLHAVMTWIQLEQFCLYVAYNMEARKNILCRELL